MRRHSCARKPWEEHMPLSLSDQQLTALMTAARPLQPLERSAFLAALAVLLRGRDEVGDGELYRSIKQLQREHFKPPTDTETGRSLLHFWTSNELVFRLLDFNNAFNHIKTEI
jgi:hypothetical protein